MVRKDMKLPESFIDEVLQYAGAEDSAKMNTAKLMSDFWLEFGKAIEENGKGRHWFVEATAAQVGMSPSSMYNRLMVGDNWIARGYYKACDDITFGAALALLRNAERKDGLVPVEILDKRLEWYYAEFDKHGAPPSVRDIENYYKRNGDHKEWEVYWNSLVRNSKKLVGVKDTPISKLQLARLILAEK
jgi:hypothetical protein